MTVLSKHLDSAATQNRLKLLIWQLHATITEIVKTCCGYIKNVFSKVINVDNFSLSQVSSIYELWSMFMRIMWKLFRFFKSLIKRLYWLLAPDIMIRLGLRHAILFTILFITPSILRAFGNPLYYHSNQLFLRLTMGREWLREYNQLTNKLKNASSYQEFCEIGQKLDVMDGSFEWKTTQASKLYNHERINQDIVLLNKIIQTCRAYEENQKNFSSRSRLQQSQRRQQQQQRHESGIDTHPMRDLMEFLRSRAIRNYCGITNPQLYDKARVGTKELIQRFKNKVCDAFEYIASCNDPEITTAEKLVYFNECRHGMFLFILAQKYFKYFLSFCYLLVCCYVTF